MRTGPRFTLILLAAATFIWLLAVVWPLTVGFARLGTALAEANNTLSESGLFNWRDVPGLLLYTISWAALVGTLSTIIGLPAAFCLARAASQRSLSSRFERALPIGMIGVLSLPPYILYWIWGLWDWPGTPIGLSLAQWIGTDPSRAALVSNALLLWALAFWTWPITAFATAASLASIPRDRLQMLRLDGASAFRRTLLLLSEARLGLLTGLALAALTTLTSYDTFDLASVFTYGNVLRRLYFGSGAGSLVTGLAALPMIALNLAGALSFIRLARDLHLHSASSAPDASAQSPPPSRWTSALAALTLIVSLGGPLSLMLWRLFDRAGLHALASMAQLEGPAIAASGKVALCTGSFFALLAAFTARLQSARHSRHPLERIASRVSALQAAAWLLIGLMPAAAIGSFLVLASSALPDSLRALLNGDQTGGIPLILVLAHLARYGFLAILVGRAIHAFTPAGLSDQNAINGADASLSSWFASHGPRLWAALIGAFCLGALLSLSEVSATIIVTPPGFQAMSDRLLNKLHYAREDSAVALCILLTFVSFAAGTLAAFLLRPLFRGADA